MRPRAHQRDAWADANAGTVQQSPSETISRIEAMEHARSLAEARAAADEAEWQRQEEELHHWEAARREDRAARGTRDDSGVIGHAQGDGAASSEAADQRLLQYATMDDECSQDGTAYDAGVDTALDEVDTVVAASAAALAATGPSTEDTCAAAAAAVAELLAVEENRRCFDCEEALARDGEEGRSAWLSLSHGLMLCLECARVHASLGPSVARVRAADEPLELTDLDAPFAGGNAAFATFLAEEMGVARRVWLALPIDARYQTPAAELYERRLRAFIDGEALPNDLKRCPPPPVHESFPQSAGQHPPE